MVYPMNRLPQSPRKIRAGWTLKSRNPSRLPMKATRIRLMKISSSDQALMNRTSAATNATPAERPSMLSRRLKALVMPTSHSRVTTTFIHSKGRNDVVRKPDAERERGSHHDGPELPADPVRVLEDDARGGQDRADPGHLGQVRSQRIADGDDEDERRIDGHASRPRRGNRV